mgnify:CR=1 FL=1
MKSALVIFLLGLACILPAYFIIDYQTRTKNWPSTEAQIDSVFDYKSDDRIYVTFDYTYTVDGNEYKNSFYSYDYNKIPWVDGRGSSLLVKRNEIKEMGSVNIYYDPEDPSDSAVEHGYNGGFLWLLGFGILFGFLGLAGILTDIYNRFKKSA